MFTYYFFHRNNYFCNGKPTLRTVECNSERWADVRTKIEELLGIDRSIRPPGKKIELASLFGCVVGRTKTPDWTAVRKLADQLPTLENGSMLLEGDLICVAVAPYRSILYIQDLYHRFWLYCLMKNYFASKGHEADFLADIKRYDLRRLVARIIALADQKAKFTVNLKKRNQILQNSFESAMLKFDAAKDTKSLLFDFGTQCVPCFGVGIHNFICQELSTVCIDMSRRTKFLSKLIRESGGDIEYGDSIAKRFGITNPQLVLLVRDVLHNYEPQYVAKEKPIELDLRDMLIVDDKEEENEEERQTKRRRIDEDASLEVVLVEKEKAAKNATMPTASDENSMIQNVVNNSLSMVEVKKETIFNMQVYCLCCDVPGHHTNMCPRLEFLENIRLSCHVAGAIPWNIFYAPENGIIPISHSTLGKFVAPYFPSKAGEINRKVLKQNIENEFVLSSVPFYNNVRWVADMT